MINCDILEQVAVLSEHDGYTKELNIISWNNGVPKYDLRTWREAESGKTMCKGITLTEEEMTALVEAMKERKNNGEH